MRKYHEKLFLKNYRDRNCSIRAQPASHRLNQRSKCRGGRGWPHCGRESVECNLVMGNRLNIICYVQSKSKSDVINFYMFIPIHK